jgi:Protein of unknown function (DUF3800)
MPINHERRLVVQSPYNKKRLGDHLRIVYIDDSKQENRYQLLCSIAVDDATFDDLEQHLGFFLYEMIQPDVGQEFEFHATDALAANPPFDKIKRDKAIDIFETAIMAIEMLRIPVIYAAVDLKKLYATNYATTNPVDMAFRILVKLIEAWFKENEPSRLGLLICDDTDKSVKHAMQNAFHLFRKRTMTIPMYRGELEHLHDDMYFGDSKWSKGIQLADICALIIGRHLLGYSDTEDLYLKLEKHIAKCACEPL